MFWPAIQVHLNLLQISKNPYLTILIQYRLYQCADKQFLSLGMDLHFMIFTNQKHCRIILLKSSFVWLLYPGKARKYLVTTWAFIVALVVIITSISSSSSSIIKCVCMRMGGFHLLRSLLFFYFFVFNLDVASIKQFKWIRQQFPHKILFPR